MSQALESQDSEYKSLFDNFRQVCLERIKCIPGRDVLYRGNLTYDHVSSIMG